MLNARRVWIGMACVSTVGAVGMVAINGRGARTSSVASSAAPASGPSDCRLPRDMSVSPSTASALSAQDDPPPKPGEKGTTRLTGTFSGDDSMVALSRYPAIAEFKVVGRDAPHERTSSEGDQPEMAGSPINAAPPGGGRKDYNLPTVSRALRLQTVKSYRGNVAQCIQVDLPGGEANGHRTADENYPRVINIGDTLLILFGPASDGTNLIPSEITAVAPDGSARLPFSGQTVNTNTWSVPAS